MFRFRIIIPSTDTIYFVLHLLRRMDRPSELPVFGGPGTLVPAWGAGAGASWEPPPPPLPSKYFSCEAKEWPPKDWLRLSTTVASEEALAWGFQTVALLECV